MDLEPLPDPLNGNDARFLDDLTVRYTAASDGQQWEVRDRSLMTSEEIVVDSRPQDEPVSSVHLFGDYWLVRNVEAEDRLYSAPDFSVAVEGRIQYLAADDALILMDDVDCEVNCGISVNGIEYPVPSSTRWLEVLAVLPDGRLFVEESRLLVHVIAPDGETESYQPSLRPLLFPARRIVSGRWLVMELDGKIEFWDLQNNRLYHEIPVTEDGAYAYTSRAGMTVNLRNEQNLAFAFLWETGELLALPGALRQYQVVFPKGEVLFMDAIRHGLHVLSDGEERLLVEGAFNVLQH